MLKLVIILRDGLGGVAIYWRNLIDALDVPVSVILTRDLHDKSNSCAELFVDNSVSFTYDGRLENRIDIYRRLVRVIPGDATTVIANEWLELAALEYMRINIKIGFVLHGDYDYYYDLATRFSNCIDQHIGVSKKICNELAQRLSVGICAPLYLPPCVPAFGINQPLLTGKRRVLFVGRFSKEKGIDDVAHTIQRLSGSRNLEFTIVSTSEYNKSSVSFPATVNIYIACSHVKMKELYLNHDIFILPSREEGFPVSLIESMQAGLVPVVSSIEAFSSIIVNGVNGYLIDVRDRDRLVEAIVELCANDSLFHQMRKNVLETSGFFEKPAYIAQKFLDFLLAEYRGIPFTERCKPAFCSRLDKPYLPNSIVIILRSCLNKISGMLT